MSTVSIQEDARAIEPDQEATQPSSGSGGSLRRRAIRAAAWAFAGDGAQQALRLAANLVVARLLVPEHFGLMAIVNVVVLGVEMFADIGIRASVIRSQRGEDPEFLNTAWTIQVLRGVLFYIVICALAWPVAAAYGARDAGAQALVYLLPVAGITALLHGFTSTKVLTLNRRLDLGRVVGLNISCQIFSISVMIIWAAVSPSVWALVAGHVSYAAMRTALSFFVAPGVSNRFAWHRESVRELFGFGKWIFLSTLLMFLAKKGDRALLGAFVPLELLGAYAIAAQLAEAIRKIIKRQAGRVMLPVCSRLLERDDPARLRRALWKVRGSLLAVAVAPLSLLSIFGQPVIGVLYGAKYAEAGWMLQLLAIGAIGSVIVMTYLPVMLAHGDSFSNFVMSGWRFALKAGAMVGCWVLWTTLGGSGVVGLVAGVAAAPFLLYVPVALAMRRYGVWMPWLDLIAAGAGGSLIFLGSIALS